MLGSNKASLSLQELYNKPTDQVNSGAPAGGIFVLVAEAQPQGGGTKVDVYHLGRGGIADYALDWAEGNKSRCPRLP
jgi:hypothetical protein